MPACNAARRSSRRASGHRPNTGCVRPFEAAQARSCCPSLTAAVKRVTRSTGRNGVSVAKLATWVAPATFAAAQSRPASTPASGPAKSGMLSLTTGRPNSRNRAGSPLAFSTNADTCGRARAITRSRMVMPASTRSDLSPPPMRRDNPPASRTPATFTANPSPSRWRGALPLPAYGEGVGVRGPPLSRSHRVLGERRLAPVTRTFAFDVRAVIVAHDARLARQRDKALAAGAADQRQVRLAREFHAPRGEARARHQDGNA